MNANESFEKLAAEFRRDTGMLAPGKDQPAAFGGSPSQEEREDAWRVWCASRAVPVIDLMMALKDSLKTSPAPSPTRTPE